MYNQNIFRARALENELKRCPIKTLNFVEFEKMRDELDNEIDQKIFDLLGLNEDEIKIIDKIRDP
jgi:hypothetical protein